MFTPWGEPAGYPAERQPNLGSCGRKPLSLMNMGPGVGVLKSQLSVYLEALRGNVHVFRDESAAASPSLYHARLLIREQTDTVWLTNHIV